MGGFYVLAGGKREEIKKNYEKKSKELENKQPLLMFLFFVFLFVDVFCNFIFTLQIKATRNEVTYVLFIRYITIEKNSLKKEIKISFLQLYKEKTNFCNNYVA